MSVLTVLVVDDEPEQGALTAEVLEISLRYSMPDRRVKILRAENGRAALRRLAAAKGRVDLIVSDHRMPVMDGGEMTRQLRTLAPNMLGRLIIVTASPEPPDFFLEEGIPVVMKQERGRHLGDRAFLTLKRATPQNK